ncbi:hypothetical protein TorRG33x02_234070 [Trema orientale]|uniref:Uncharacterized protein n=1 Tax=Trema orientale TaxID=63057 RepID=A0A2P5E4E7_TREOI|nr:hypothetical protein TorRG33x02_234070 [Trema orientale]
MWRVKHFNSDSEWIAPDLEAYYDRVMVLRAQHPPNVLTYKEIMERVLDRHSVHLTGHSSYEEHLVELSTTRNRLKEVERGLDECRQVLRGQGRMFAPSNLSPISDQNFGPTLRPHSMFYLSTSHPEAHTLSSGANEHDST